MNSELEKNSSNIWKVDPPMNEHIICWSAQGAGRLRVLVGSGCSNINTKIYAWFALSLESSRSKKGKRFAF